MSGTHSAPWGRKRESASQRAAKVIGGVAMAARKSRAAQPQNLLDFDARPALCQQSARHPQIYDAPVRLCKALRNVPAPHPELVNLPGPRAGEARWNSPLPRRRRPTGMRFGVACGGLFAGSLQEAIGVARQSRSGMDNFHPRRIGVAVAALRLLTRSPPYRCAKCRPTAVARTGGKGVALTCTQACQWPGLVWSTTQGSWPFAHIDDNTTGSA
jgi:hypothetical protein